MSPSQHKPFSVRQQPYNRRFKRITENIISLVLILITVSSLSLAAVNFFCSRTEDPSPINDNNALMPAIYIHNRESDSVSI